MFRWFLSRCKGASFTEYALIISLVSIVSIGAVSEYGKIFANSEERLVGNLQAEPAPEKKEAEFLEEDRALSAQSFSLPDGLIGSYYSGFIKNDLSVSFEDNGIIRKLSLEDVSISLAPDAQLPDGLSFNEENSSLSGILKSRYSKPNIPIDVSYDGLKAQLELSLSVYDAPFEISSSALGHSHNCILTKDGAVKCWGFNWQGALGNGTGKNSYKMVSAFGLNDSIVSLTSGANHSCALNISGEVWCWGTNLDGQLGNGDLGVSLIPDKVKSTALMVQVSAGGYHSCSLDVSGTAYCWGEGASGQLGVGSSESSSLPVEVLDVGSPFTKIVAGGFHTCGLTNGGAVWCWGLNSDGQLGFKGDDGSLWDYFPTQVPSLSEDVIDIALGVSHSCALKRSGDMFCFGKNSQGQLGNGKTQNAHTPQLVAELSGRVRSMALAARHTCAVTNSSDAWCWGQNGDGQLGDGTVNTSAVPVQLVGLSNPVAEIDTFNNNTCVVLDNSIGYCWGDGSNSFGDGLYVPGAVTSPSMIKAAP